MSAPQPLHVLPSPRHAPTGVPFPTHAQGRAERAMAATSTSPYVQDSLAVDFTAPNDQHLIGPRQTRAHDLPDPQQWAEHIAQALIEVMHGVRPPSQVMRWSTPEVYAVVARRGSRAARRAAHLRERRRVHRTKVTRVLVCEPAEDVAEASVVIVDGGRVRALAMRLVGRNGRWLVEALQVG